MRLFAPLLAAALLCTGAVFDAPTESDADAPADTLRLAVRSGEPLVVPLPGPPETTFRVVRAPALSWLVGRSFFWKTLPAERGREFILIERQEDDETRDTLVLAVEVGP